jgi:hypothetical protein
MARKKAFRKLLELLKTVPGCAPAVMVKNSRAKWEAPMECAVARRIGKQTLNGIVVSHSRPQ